jgi:hypothetical protein
VPRATLTRLLLLALTLLPSLARAQDYFTLRGNYYRDRNTRVIQPTVEIAKETTSGTVVGAHYLLDAITSASAAAGVLGDNPFTELRNEAGFHLGQRIGPAQIGAGYSYSSESDYWAHFVWLAGAVDLFEKNTTLGLTVSYGNDRVANRIGPNGYVPLGGLQKVGAVATVTQVLSAQLLGTLAYQVDVLGFGDASNGWQSNPYRLVSLGGSPVREFTPYQRIRQSAAAALYWLVPLHMGRLRYIAFRPSYRFYWDDWGLLSHTTELRMHVPIEPFELRVSGRHYTQNAVSFWAPSWTPGFTGPSYAGAGLFCTTCTLVTARTTRFYTADPKLDAYSSAFVELRLLIKLNWLGRWPRVPGLSWFSRGVVDFSYGHYFNGGYAHTAFGDAEVAGTTWSWPL